MITPLKLLFLAHPFPPFRTIASVRTWNIAKYLARSGWDITVVTIHPSLLRHVDHPKETDANLEREGIRRILTGHRWRCLVPDDLKWWNQGLGWLVGGVCRRIARHRGIEREIGWIKAAEQACSALTSEDVDLILASGPPFASFKLAKRLSERLGRPYVLDYRDPWTRRSRSARQARAAAVREEERLLAGCAAVTVVSPSMSLAMDRRFGLGPKLHVVTNGYDPEEPACVEPYNFDHFAIVYAGNFYARWLVISPVMAALKRLEKITNRRDAKYYFHYYGVQEKHVREEAERFGVMERVVLHGNVPRAEALSAIRGAGVAVVISSVAEEATLYLKGVVTGKIFEILGLGTPILLIAPAGSDIQTIVETAGGARSFTGKDIDGMAAFLSDAMFGRIPERKDSTAYAWPSIIKGLDAVLREAAEKRLQPMHGRQLDHDQQTV